MVLFLIGLLISGLTAFPLLHEVRWLAACLGIPADASPAQEAGLRHWIALVREGLTHTYAQYPFIAYGTDWLAFAHLLFAVLFAAGPLRDPVRQRWVIDFGLFACVAVVPLALICGPLRGIPAYWRLIDCSFGVLGAVPLWMCRRAGTRLERVRTSSGVSSLSAGAVAR